MSPLVLITLSCFFFSILAALIKFNSTFIHPIEQAFFRNILSIFILLPFFVRKKLVINKKGNIKYLILRGLLGGITMILLFWSYALIPLSQAMSISFSTPLFMYFGSIIFFREKVDKQNTLLTCVGFLLTLVIIRPDLSLQLGTFLAILAAITHATAGLLVKKLSETETVLTLMLSMVILMTPITFIPSIYVWKTPNSVNIQILLFSIALVATLGNYFWTKSISMEKLTNLMPFDFTKLIFATLLGFIFFDEKIDLVTLICGSGLILCNTLIATKINKNEKIKTILPNN
tara:strand:+ start:518 stop:1384 length:867 start_codon:yes stop_codon:yes gene_type:complete